jgi:hypothetical protein
MSATKKCIRCHVKKERHEFFEEPHDTITGLSGLCIACIEEKKRKQRKRKITGWHTTSPAGLPGTVLNVREETTEIVVRFKGARTVVLPMVEHG